MNITAHFEYVRHKYLIKLIPRFALSIYNMYKNHNAIMIYNDQHDPLIILQCYVIFRRNTLIT